MTASARLADLGLTLPDVAVPVGAYIPARRHGDLIYTSGQLPFQDGALVVTGQVGPNGVSTADAAGAARTAVLNALAAAAHTGGGIDRLTGVVRLTGFVASAPEFTDQPVVLNGASDLLLEIFGDAGRHARSAVGVAALPLGSAVEVELVVSVATD